MGKMKHKTLKLGNAEVWYSSGASGQWIDTYNADDPLLQITARIFADQAGTLVLEESNDGVTPSTSITVAVAANTPAVLPWTIFTKRWYRLKFTNGATVQTIPMLLFEEIRRVSEGGLVGVPKGTVKTVHNAITATALSDEIDCRDFNAVLVFVDISAAFNWTFKVQGAPVSGGTFADCYEQANTGVMTLMSYQCNASRVFLFKGIPDFIKINANEDADGATVTVKIQPLNV